MTTATTRALHLPSLWQCEKTLCEPAAHWKGRCYEIASRIVDAGLLPEKSVAVYGHWLGPIAKTSMFAAKAGLSAQHGWVLLSDCRVFDPTRWVFEDVAPYLYVGPSDHYDEGGNQWRQARQPTSAPEFDPGDEVYELTKRVLPDAAAWAFIERTLALVETAMEHSDYEIGTVTRAQLHWLAHRDPRSFGPHAHAIYSALSALGLIAWIPIDNLKMIERLSGKKVRAAE